MATLQARQARALEVHAERKRALFARIAGRLRIEPIDQRIARSRERLAALDERSARAFTRSTERRRERLDRTWRLAETLSYRSVLARGFALVADATGKPVRGAAVVVPGEALVIEFQDGKVGAVATGAPAAPKPKRAAKTKTAGQESLF